MNANYLASPPWNSYQASSRMTLSESASHVCCFVQHLSWLARLLTGFTMVPQVGHNVTYLFGSYHTNGPGIHVK